MAAAIKSNSIVAVVEAWIVYDLLAGRRISSKAGYNLARRIDRFHLQRPNDP